MPQPSTAPPLNPKDADELRKLSHDHPVVFFDGVCGLCNAVVDWILARDGAARFRFAPLQGPTAALILSEQERADLDTVVVLKNDVVHRRSTAIAEVLEQLGGVWSAGAIAMRLLPVNITDLGYRFVAEVRYRIWGKRETCRLPTKEERGRFFD